MDWAMIVIATVFFGLTVKALCANHRGSGRAKRRKREVGYLREEIHINAATMPEFKPTWPDMRHKGEAR